MWDSAFAKGNDMRRLARHLFTLCSAVSLVLCVAVCVLWVRSHFRADWLIWAEMKLMLDSNGRSPDHVRLASEAGRITYSHTLPLSVEDLRNRLKQEEADQSTS